MCPGFHLQKAAFRCSGKNNRKRRGVILVNVTFPVFLLIATLLTDLATGSGGNPGQSGDSVCNDTSPQQLVSSPPPLV